MSQFVGLLEGRVLLVVPTLISESKSGRLDFNINHCIHATHPSINLWNAMVILWRQREGSYVRRKQNTEFVD